MAGEAPSFCVPKAQQSAAVGEGDRCKQYRAGYGDAENPRGCSESPTSPATSQVEQPTHVDEDPAEEQQQLVGISSRHYSIPDSNTDNTDNTDNTGRLAVNDQVENADVKEACEDVQLKTNIMNEVDAEKVEELCVTESTMDVDDCDTDTDEARSEVYIDVKLEKATDTSVIKTADSGGRINHIRGRHVKTNKQQDGRSKKTVKKDCSESAKQGEGQRKTKTHRCRVCKKSFSSTDNREEHMMEHTGSRYQDCVIGDYSGEKPYKCLVCDKYFAQKALLTVHLRIHSGEKPYNCSLCDKSFARNDSLTKHTRVHTGEKPYQCLMCEKSFAESSALTKHTRVHTGERPYQCSVCGKSFARSNHLTIHARVHTGEKKYQCSECGKSFAHSSHLKTHSRIHTGEKPYQCSMCDKSFAENGALTKHTRVHTGEKPYPCPECDKSFAERNALTKHTRVHTGEKPYECALCHKSFADCSALRRHTRLHNVEKQYQCSVCGASFSDNHKLTTHKQQHTE